MSDFRKAMQECLAVHHVSFDAAALAGMYAGQAHEMTEQMFDLFYGTECFSESLEQGCSPSEYMQSLVLTFLDEMEIKWALSSIQSHDEWETAELTFTRNDRDEPFVIQVTHLEAGDWVPMSFFDAMEALSGIDSDQVLKTYFSDDPFIVIKLPKSCAEELSAIVEKYTIPYY